MIPTAKVIRRPAPRLSSNPGPAVPVFPNPATVTIRRPVRSHRGNPHILVVGGIVLPAPVLVQILGSVNVGIDVLRRPRTCDLPVARLIPAIPFIESRRGHNLEFHIRRVPANHHHLAGPHVLGAALSGYLRFSRSNYDLRCAVFPNCDPISAPL